MLYILSIVVWSITLLLVKVTAQDKFCAAERCGDLLIEYPFGKAGTNCSYNQFFTVTCNSTATHKPKLFLSHYNLEVVQFINTIYGNREGHMIVNVPVRTCDEANIHKSSRWRTPNFIGSPFTYDMDNNVFAFVGCGGKATLYDDEGTIMASCNSSCRPAETVTDYGCKGYYCCQKDVMLADANAGSYFSIEVSMKQTGLCRSAFLISKIFADANATVTMAMGSSTAPIQLMWSTSDFKLSLLEILITVCSVLSLLLVSLGAIWTCWFFLTRKTRKESRLRSKYFKDRLAQSLSDSEVANKTKLFSMNELKKATDEFNENRILGKGGQGTVYKGMLSDGQIIAVKRSKSFEDNQWQQFINEVILLSQVNHRHVVKLLGCCLETKLPLVVYEFVSNGDLSNYIHNSTGKELLTWLMRKRIALESAGAIAYLHTSSSTPIYHRDIKSTNILLDDKYQAKVSDFGISKGVTEDQTHLTTCVRGTFGCMDPEYFRSSHFSEKSDVFSFGVILVEILTGQKPIRETSSEEEERSLVVYFLSAMGNSKLEDILDPMVLAQATKEEIVRVARIAAQCLHPRGIERPTMVEVVMELSGLGNTSTAQQEVSCETTGVWNGKFNSAMTNVQVTSDHEIFDEEECLVCTA